LDARGLCTVDSKQFIVCSITESNSIPRILPNGMFRDNYLSLSLKNRRILYVFMGH